MTEEYEKLIKRAGSHHEIMKKKLALVAKKKIKNFDHEVHAIHAKVFEEIDCTKCANCCKTLGPKFNETDIVRISSELGMRRVAFASVYLHEDEDGDLVLAKLPCHFLGDDSMCEIYDARPRACKNYPHTEEKNVQPKMRLLAMNTLYCPAAVLIADELIAKFAK
jgi:Fe-S-cluster containining protein